MVTEKDLACPAGTLRVLALKLTVAASLVTGTGAGIAWPSFMVVAVPAGICEMV